MAWLAIVALLLGAATVWRAEIATQATAEGVATERPSPTDSVGGLTLRVKGDARIGSFSCQYSERGDQTSVLLDGTSYGSAQASGELTVTDRDDGFVVTFEDQSYRFKSRDDGGYSVRDAQGAVLYRAKVKEDKFNIYDSGGRRLYYGKTKDGTLYLRDDGGAKIGRIEGTSDLALAAILAVPLPKQVRAAALAHNVHKLMP